MQVQHVSLLVRLQVKQVLYHQTNTDVTQVHAQGPQVLGVLQLTLDLTPCPERHGHSLKAVLLTIIHWQVSSSHCWLVLLAVLYTECCQLALQAGVLRRIVLIDRPYTPIHFQASTVETLETAQPIRSPDTRNKALLGSQYQCLLKREAKCRVLA